MEPVRRCGANTQEAIFSKFGIFISLYSILSRFFHSSLSIISQINYLHASLCLHSPFLEPMSGHLRKLLVDHEEAELGARNSIRLEQLFWCFWGKWDNRIHIPSLLTPICSQSLLPVKYYLLWMTHIPLFLTVSTEILRPPQAGVCPSHPNLDTVTSTATVCAPTRLHATAWPIFPKYIIEINIFIDKHNPHEKLTTRQTHGLIGYFKANTCNHSPRWHPEAHHVPPPKHHLFPSRVLSFPSVLAYEHASLNTMVYSCQLKKKCILGLLTDRFTVHLSLLFSAILVEEARPFVPQSP